MSGFFDKIFVQDETVCLVIQHGQPFLGIFKGWDEHGFVIVNCTKVKGNPTDISDIVFSFEGKYTTVEDIDYQLSKPQMISVFKEYSQIHFTYIPNQLYRDKIGITERPIKE